MKKWYQSKTIWTNIIAGIIAIIGILDENFLKSIGFTDPTKFLAVVGGITTVLNIILRAFTSLPIAPLNNSANDDQK